MSGDSKRKGESILTRRKWTILFFGLLSFGYLSLVVFTGMLLPVSYLRSDSMLPTLAQGDLVVVKSVSTNNLDVNSIIVYEPPKPYPSPTMHRIVNKWVEGNVVYFQTKGDNNDSPDSYRITASNIIAEYTGIRIPFLGYIIIYIQTPLGITVFIGVIALWVIYTYFIKEDQQK